MRSGLRGHGEPTAYFTVGSLEGLGLPHALTTRHCPGVTSFAEPISPEAPRAPFRAEAAAVLGGAGLEMGRVTYGRPVHGAGAARAPVGGGFAGSGGILAPGRRRGAPPALHAAFPGVLAYRPHHSQRRVT